MPGQYPARVALGGRTGNTVRVALRDPDPLTSKSAGQKVRNAVTQGAAIAGDARPSLRTISTHAPVLGAIAALASSQNARVGVRDFFEGVAGIEPDKPDYNAPAGKFEDPRTGTDAVSQALATGKKAAPSPLTPQERVLAFVDSVLRKPATLREAQAVTGLLPAQTKPVPAKDSILAQSAAISDQIYLDELKAARAGAASEADYRKAFDKATTAQFQRQAGLVGFNPLQLAQAGMFAPDEDQ